MKCSYSRDIVDFAKNLAISAKLNDSSLSIFLSAAKSIVNLLNTSRYLW